MSDYGRARCGICGERFMGQDKAEVVKKGDPEHHHLIIHANCYSEEDHELA